MPEPSGRRKPFVIPSAVGLGGDDDDVDDADDDGAHVRVVRDPRATGYAPRAKPIGGGCGGGDSDDHGDHMSKAVRARAMPVRDSLCVCDGFH